MWCTGLRYVETHPYVKRSQWILFNVTDNFFLNYKQTKTKTNIRQLCVYCTITKNSASLHSCDLLLAVLMCGVLLLFLIGIVERLIEAANGVIPDRLQRYAVAKEVANVGDLVEDHGGPLE